MIWLELRTHDDNYLLGWNQTQSVWAPTLKENGSNWPFWGLVKNVVAGDIIFHLRHSNRTKKFIGYSTALTDGYLTYENPSTQPYNWGFSQQFYKVDLTNFQPFVPEIRLEDFFKENNSQLRDYYINNKQDRNNHRRLFYTIQSNRLQCLFGAYFSEFEEPLVGMLTSEIKAALATPEVHSTTNTGTILTTLTQRIGQQSFSDNVKNNYNYKCCYPGCEVEGRGFLIGGHIARWADNKRLRGHTGNGLCLCLMHDKAFEKGLFTINSDYKVTVLKKNINANSKWLSDLLVHGNNLEIKPRIMDPLLEALESHWIRIGHSY